VDGVSARAKRRWLVRWWIAQGVVLWLGVPAVPALAGAGHGDTSRSFEALGDPEYSLWMAGFALVFAFVQWLYLRPVRAPQAGRRPVRLVWSMVIGGLALSALLAALLLAAAGVADDLVRIRPKVFDDESAWWALLGITLLNWVLATPLLLAFASRSHSAEDHLRRVATVLFAGTVIEILAVTPLDVLARRHEDCWCGRGTLLAISLALTVGLVLVGPVVFLVLLARRRRRWPGGKCAACGADIGEDLRIARCPACGAGWAE
jgi:hypothetical protein